MTSKPIYSLGAIYSYKAIRTFGAGACGSCPLVRQRQLRRKCARIAPAADRGIEMTETFPNAKQRSDKPPRVGNRT